MDTMPVTSPNPWVAGRPHGHDSRKKRLLYLVMGSSLLVLLVTFIAVFRVRGSKLGRHHSEDEMAALQRRKFRTLHGYGPQLLLCTVGELSRATDGAFPRDGVCDILIYTHVTTFSDLETEASPNLRTFWRLSRSSVSTKYGYSFSRESLSSNAKQVREFLTESVRKYNIRALGMLSTAWTRRTDVKPYLEFFRTLEAAKHSLAHRGPSKDVVIVFGVKLSNYSRQDAETFLSQHNSILGHVQILVYETHSDTPYHTTDKDACISRFTTPRLYQTGNGEQTLQDAVGAMDTLHHSKGHNLTYDVCASLTLSAHRFLMKADVDLNRACRNVSAAAYKSVCNPKDVEPAKVVREGIVVADTRKQLLDIYDAPETIVEKLKSIKAALLLVAPHWSFCVTVFHVEHEDHAGVCGPKFMRLLVTRSYLQGTLHWV